MNLIIRSFRNTTHQISVCGSDKCFAKNYHIKVTKICNLLPDNGTSVRRIVVCWASVQNFKAERIEQVGSLEIRVNLKTERNDIYF